MTIFSLLQSLRSLCLCSEVRASYTAEAFSIVENVIPTMLKESANNLCCPRPVFTLTRLCARALISACAHARLFRLPTYRLIAALARGLAHCCAISSSFGIGCRIKEFRVCHRHSFVGSRSWPVIDAALYVADNLAVSVEVCRIRWVKGARA